jgi:hypothetical protein
VTAVDKSSITLRGTGEKEPMRFPAGGVLVGERPISSYGGFGYPLADVRVGDIVCIETVHIDGADICVEVIIYRRPGGKIPPWPGDDVPGVRIRRHERNQAYQDWEEKGIPIPEKFRPVDPRSLAVPFPPVAPMPREAKPKPKA